MLSVIFVGLLGTLAAALMFSNLPVVDVFNITFVNLGIVLIIGFLIICFICTVLLFVVKIGIENITDFIKNKRWEDKK